MVYCRRLCLYSSVAPPRLLINCSTASSYIVDLKAGYAVGVLLHCRHEKIYLIIEYCFEEARDFHPLPFGSVSFLYRITTTSVKSTTPE